MRLIDADALKDQFAWLELCSLSKNEIFKIINEAPSVEPDKIQAIMSDYLVYRCAPQRPQGEWIEKHCDYGVYYRCSNCHKMPPNYECDYKEGAIKTNYCPNCGADMRGEEE